ncbi:MAG: S8 family serine peptidase, partial [Nitriliruptorales bacterium]|nr:S8 family serine peptidase [Nitriliruptorales bacterium]
MRARFVRLSIVAMAASLALAAAAPAPVARGIATEVLDELASRWIVVLEDGVDADDMTSGLLVTHRYEHALNGYAAVLTDATARRLARTPGVLIVERDQQLSITAELPTGVDRIDGDEAPAAGIGSGAAVDVDVAVLDTGIDSGHRDLDVVSHVNCVSTFLGLFGGGGGCNAGGSDGHGHGTHVAGTIGARDNGLDVVGVAPGARLWGVKVLSDAGAGSSSDIIAGIDWVTARADQIEVINMSLGGSGTSSATNSAIQGATNAGVVVVVAAGNDSANASGYTPANAPDVITVSAFSDTDGAPGGNGNSCSGADDSFASYSNYGAVVEIAAPGSCIRSTRAGGGTTSMSGTSMASPHVAGAAALWIAANNVPRNADRRDAVLDGLLTSWSVPQASECGFTGGRSGEPALHLTACGASPGNAAPTVTITAPADNTTVDEGTEITFTGSASDAEDGDLSGAIEWSSSLDG